MRRTLIVIGGVSSSFFFRLRKMDLLLEFSNPPSAKDLDLLIYCAVCPQPRTELHEVCFVALGGWKIFAALFWIQSTPNVWIVIFDIR